MVFIPHLRFKIVFPLRETWFQTQPAGLDRLQTLHYQVRDHSRHRPVVRRDEIPKGLAQVFPRRLRYHLARANLGPG